MPAGRKTGGRTKGTPNKTTAGVKSALTAAFEQIGGTKKLAEWAEENPGKFYELWAKLLPQEIKAELDHKGTIKIEIVRFTDEGN